MNTGMWDEEEVELYQWIEIGWAVLTEAEANVGFEETLKAILGHHRPEDPDEQYDEEDNFLHEAAIGQVMLIEAEADADWKRQLRAILCHHVRLPERRELLGLGPYMQAQILPFPAQSRHYES
jgi:hypothetical protein